MTDLEQLRRLFHQDRAAFWMRAENFDVPESWTLRSLAAQEEKGVEHGLHILEQALERYPDNVDILLRLSSIYTDIGKGNEGATAALKALEKDPSSVAAMFAAATAYGMCGKPDYAVHWFQEGLKLDPTNYGALTNLASRLKDIGRIEAAVAMYERALLSAPNQPSVLSNRCYAEQFRSGVSLKSLYDIHGRWKRQFAELLATRPIPGVKTSVDLSKPLRIGLPSPDFRKHPVAYYLLPVVRELYRLGCELYCYQRSAVSDELTAQFKGLATKWTDAVGMRVPDLATTIVSDQLDVAIDLSGHTAGSLLQMFAQRVAPIQLSWLGYVGTLGVPNIDAVVTSAAVSPPGVEPFQHEGLLRLSTTHQCYEPHLSPDIDPEVASVRNGYVTFGSLTNIAKLNSEVCYWWSSILKRVPNSRLRIRGIGADSQLVRELVDSMFASYGVTDRVELAGYLPHAEALAALNDIDVLLDPHPFSGCTTTCEALWMGLQPITLPGQTHASRHTLGFLTAAGLTHTVASSGEEYIRLACDMANSAPYRRQFRQTCREHLRASPLMDAAGTAKSLLQGIRQLAVIRKIGS